MNKGQHEEITKGFHFELELIKQRLKEASANETPKLNPDTIRPSRERSLAITKIQEAQFWLAEDAKNIGEGTFVLVTPKDEPQNQTTDGSNPCPSPAA